MDERPTKKIITPVGQKEIVLKEWINGRENEYIAAPMYDMVTADANQGQPDIKVRNMSAQINEGNHRAISTVVISIAGSTDNILDTVLDMIHDDYEFILSEIEKVTKKKEVKTKP